ncbi:MAG: tetratricopeptide repeat protein [Nitrospirae bacterium]|nr:tetratricopeptide repeat protein [Nitrospirota bacterium]
MISSSGLYRRLFTGWGVLGLFFMIGGALYANALNNGFHSDDYHHILENPSLKSAENIPRYFTDPETFGRDPLLKHYRPLLLTSYSLNYALGGPDPAGYRLVNLAFHVGSAFLIYLIVISLVRTSRRDSENPASPGGGALPGFAAGLIFLVHPLNAEGVNYITARSSVMGAFFYLLAFWCWMKYRAQTDNIGSGSRKYYIASLLAVLAAVWTKEIAVSLPLALWLHDRYLAGTAFRPARPSGRTSWTGSIVPLIPAALIVVLFSIGARIVFFSEFFTGTPDRSLWVQGLTGAKVIGQYVILWILPWGLTIAHDMEPAVSLDLHTLMALGLLAGLTAAAVWLWIKGGNDGKVCAFFMAWFLVAHLPTTMVSLNVIFQENRGYLPAAALAGLTGMALERGGRLWRSAKGRPILPWVFLGFLVAACFILVWQRNPVWKDSVTLFTDAVKKSPMSTMAHVELGRAYVRTGRSAEGEREYLTVLRLDPWNPQALNELGSIYGRRGDLEKAETYFKRAVEAAPWHTTARSNLAAVSAAKEGDKGLGIDWLRGFSGQSGSLDPVEVWVVNEVKKRPLPGVKEDLIRMKGEEPGNPAVRFALGVVYRLEGDWTRAEDALLETLRIRSAEVPVLLDLASVRMALGREDAAATALRQALEIEPDTPAVHQAWGVYYQKRRRYDLALKAYDRVLQLKPEAFRVHYNKGVIFAEQERYAEATAEFRKALTIQPDYLPARSALDETLRRGR